MKINFICLSILNYSIISLINLINDLFFPLVIHQLILCITVTILYFFSLFLIPFMMFFFLIYRFFCNVFLILRIHYILNTQVLFRFLKSNLDLANTTLDFVTFQVIPLKYLNIFDFIVYLTFLPSTVHLIFYITKNNFKNIFVNFID